MHGVRLPAQLQTMLPMPSTLLHRPSSDEYAPYYSRYIDLLPEGDLFDLLEQQRDETLTLMKGLSEEAAARRYAPGKWSLKEVLGHVIDTERIFAYRALCISRGERQPLPGYDQDAYVAGANFDARTVVDLAEEHRAVRQATVALFRSLDEAELNRRGIANEVELSVRATAYIIAGHERHHIRIIHERYLTP